jgi:predicted ArsR family transcriptional regulator
VRPKRDLGQAVLAAAAELGNINVVKTSVGLVELPAGGERADVRTRDRVAKALLEHGPVSAATLADLLGLTPAAVRRHLDALTAAGRVVEVAERPVRGKVRGRGRLFALSEAGRSSFPHGYDELAVSALRYLSETGGPEAVEAFATQRLAGVEARYEALLADADPGASRVELLAAALSDDGFAASVQVTPAGVQLCQHHCPVAQVAVEFPALCEAETATFSRLLGTHVQRLATLAHGDGVCTTHVPCSSQAASTPVTGGTPA